MPVSFGNKRETMYNCLVRNRSLVRAYKQVLVPVINVQKPSLEYRLYHRCYKGIAKVIYLSLWNSCSTRAKRRKCFLVPLLHLLSPHSSTHTFNDTRKKVYFEVRIYFSLYPLLWWTKECVCNINVRQCAVYCFRPIPHTMENVRVNVWCSG
jgi:hypothetical protein